MCESLSPWRWLNSTVPSGSARCSLNIRGKRPPASTAVGGLHIRQDAKRNETSAISVQCVIFWLRLAWKHDVDRGQHCNAHACQWLFDSWSFELDNNNSQVIYKVAKHLCLASHICNLHFIWANNMTFSNKRQQLTCHSPQTVRQNTLGQQVNTNTTLRQTFQSAFIIIRAPCGVFDHLWCR